MSYHIEGKDIVIDGFESGIADSPYKGIADMRNANIIPVPGEAAVNFDTTAMILPPAVNADAFTADATTDRITWTPGARSFYKGLAIVFNTIGTTVGISINRVYYVGAISGSTFKVYTSIEDAFFDIDAIDITVSGSGTFTTYQMRKATHRCTDNGAAQSTTVLGINLVASYIIDTSNQVWLLASYAYPNASTWTPGAVYFLGNRASTISSGDNSIAVWNNYLFVFRAGATDYWPIDLGSDPQTTWVYAWAGYTPTSSTASLRSLAAQDDALYICNGSSVGSILTNPNETFDPTDSSTYTATETALQLPLGEVATCLAELGTTLLVGGIRTFIYPWDRVSTSYSYPIVVPERYVSLIVATQSNAYIFAGNRGNIYYTNGANVDLFKKIPDYLSGSYQPYYMTGSLANVNTDPTAAEAPMGDAIYWRGQIYFSFVAYSNAKTLLTTVGGVWAIDLETKALRLTQKLSYDTYAGSVPCIVPDMFWWLPGGEGLFAGWIDGSGNYGVDNTVTTPYTNYETYFELDMIPIGTFIDPATTTQIEWKTSAPLVAGESFRFSYRLNITDAFALITDQYHTTGESGSAGALSDMIQTNFQKAQWVQLKVESKSTASSPSYARLTQVRLRDLPLES